MIEYCMFKIVAKIKLNVLEGVDLSMITFFAKLSNYCM